MSVVGKLIGPLVVGDIAHGGHCVARDGGRVIFVRHALPGESVTVRLTDTSHERYWRGDAVEVHQASPLRVEAPCAIGGQCGGCDFQHVAPDAQRDLKKAVVAEQLARLGGISWDGVVEEVPGGNLRWRTRMRYRTDATGRLGMRAHRSHDIVPLPDEGCLIAQRPLHLTDWPPDTDVTVAGTAVSVAGERIEGSEMLTEFAAGRSWDVATDGFWQIHPAAADTLVRAVVEALQPEPGERALDLYCGVGLFAGALTEHGVRVQGVDSHRGTIELARGNVPSGTFWAGRVEQAISRLWRRVDLVVLDPPRAGAGRGVVEAVASRRPRAVAYVACDPAALGRDLGYFAKAGYVTREVRAFDLFPMTHHVECVALLTPERV